MATLLVKPEGDGYLMHPGIRGKRCVECGIFPEVENKDWFTCSICSAVVCANCQKAHVPLCFAKTWGMVEVGPDGELINVEKPRTFNLG